MDLPEHAPWYAGMAAACAATLHALRPFFGWVGREYNKRSEHLRKLQGERIAAERKRIEQNAELIAAVGKLIGVVEGLHASVESLHGFHGKTLQTITLQAITEAVAELVSETTRKEKREE